VGTLTESSTCPSAFALQGQSLTIAVTDIEGSTALWDQHPDEMHAALNLHDQMLRNLLVKHNG